MKKCSKCGQMNPLLERTCKVCGHDKFEMTDEADAATPPAYEAAAARGGSAPETRAGPDDGFKSEPEVSARPLNDGGEKPFTVLLIGFSTSGKTWFLERTKRLFSKENRGGHKARIIIPSPKAHDEEAEGTRDREDHTIGWNDEPTEYHIIDLPGERLTSLFSEEGGVGSNKSAEQLLGALSAADAVMLVLPADDLLFAKDIAGERYQAFKNGAFDAPALNPTGAPFGALDFGELENLVAELRDTSPPADDRLGAAWQAQVEAVRKEHANQQAWDWARRAFQVERLIEDIQIVAAVIRLTEVGLGPADLLNRPRQHLLDYVAKGFGHVERPLFVAISKSDLILKPMPEFAALLRNHCTAEALEALDRDPLQTLREKAPVLWDKRGLFRWARADFVTSFYGHAGGKKLDYENTTPLGVGKVVKWMKDTRLIGPVRAWALSRARTLRDLRDGATLDRRPGVQGWQDAILHKLFGHRWLIDLFYGSPGGWFAVAITACLALWTSAWLAGVMPGEGVDNGMRITPPKVTCVEHQRLVQADQAFRDGYREPVISKAAERIADGVKLLSEVRCGGPHVEGARAVLKQALTETLAAERQRGDDAWKTDPVLTVNFHVAAAVLGDATWKNEALVPRLTEAQEKLLGSADEVFDGVTPPWRDIRLGEKAFKNGEISTLRQIDEKFGKLEDDKSARRTFRAWRNEVILREMAKPQTRDQLIREYGSLFSIWRAMFQQAPGDRLTILVAWFQQAPGGVFSILLAGLLLAATVASVVAYIMVYSAYGWLYRSWHYKERQAMLARQSAAASIPAS